MNVLVLNCGSSTVKFQVIATDRERIESDADRKLAWGSIDRIGGRSQLSFQVEGHPPLRESKPQRDHRAAVESIVSWVISDEAGISGLTSMKDIHAVGHRVVHGGERFQASTIIGPDVEEGIRDCVNLAPLHNPANLRGIESVRRLMGPSMPQVAVFDTAFHSTMPPSSYLYAVPYQLYRRHGIRRYGFHGTSHRYVAYRYRKLTGRTKDEVEIISLHLGNGCSACAIAQGRSMDTSMGMTPLEGLVMGTRCGDIDPSLVEHLCEVEGYTPGETDTFLNRNSGLLGISGLTGDMRDLLAERQATGDRRATLAIDIFCYRVRKYVGAYLAALEGAQALCFAGGIGENSPEIRAQICLGLKALGFDLDEQLNALALSGAHGRRISRQGSPREIYVISTDEELLIARDTVRLLLAAGISS